MAIYIVSYDLRRNGQNYPGLIAELEKTNHFKLQQSVWIIESHLKETGIRDILRRYIDANDTIFVSEVSKSWAGLNMTDCGKWLNQKGY